MHNSLQGSVVYIFEKNYFYSTPLMKTIVTQKVSLCAQSAKISYSFFLIELEKIKDLKVK